MYLAHYFLTADWLIFFPILKYTFFYAALKTISLI